MKNYFYFLILLFLNNSCKENSDRISDQDDMKPAVVVDKLLSNQDQWWDYQYNDISLSSEFEPIDTSFNVIPKGKFLWELTSGNYVPIEMDNDSVKTYKLYAIPPKLKSQIGETIKNLANKEWHFYLLEGKPFPEFEAKNLDNQLINNNTLIGKTTVIKTWFINCKPCIAEMPELNKLVHQYEGENVQFISLALDTKEELEEFLEKTEFNYAVLPEQKVLIQDVLKLNAYPTHIIVNKSGEIVKVFDKGSELIPYLNEFMKDPDRNLKSNSITPPPPPGPTKTNSKEVKL